MSSNETSVKKNFIYNASYQLLVIIIPLIITPYLARVIGPEGTGIYSFNASISSYFSMFILLGLQNYGSRTISSIKDDTTKINSYFCNIYFMQLFCGILVILAYILYLIFFSVDKKAAILFIPFLLGYLLDISWFFYGLEDFKTITIRNVIIKVLTILLIFIFVKNENDVYKYIFIYTISIFISSVLLWVMIPKKISKIEIDKKSVLNHIKPNLLLFIPIIAISLYKIMDKIMLGIMVNTLEVGFYETTERILNVPMALINALGIVMIPRMANIYSNNKGNDSYNYINNSIEFVLFISSSMSVGIMSVAKEFVPVFLGKGYDKCIILFYIIFPSAIFMGFANVIRTQYLIPKNKDKSYIVSIFSGALINMIINLILIPRYKSLGAGIGTLIAEGTVCVMQCIIVRKELPIIGYARKSIKYVIASSIMFLVNYNINLGNGIIALSGKIIIGVLVYLIVLSPYIVKLLKNNRRVRK